MAQRMCKVRPSGPNVPDPAALKSSQYGTDWRTLKEGEEKLVPLTVEVRKWIKNGTLIPCCPVSEAAVPLEQRKPQARAMAAADKAQASQPNAADKAGKKGSDR